MSGEWSLIKFVICHHFVVAAAFFSDILCRFLAYSLVVVLLLHNFCFILYFFIHGFFSGPILSCCFPAKHNLICWNLDEYLRSTGNKKTERERTALTILCIHFTCKRIGIRKWSGCDRTKCEFTLCTKYHLISQNFFYSAHILHVAVAAVVCVFGCRFIRRHRQKQWKIVCVVLYRSRY